MGSRVKLSQVKAAERDYANAVGIWGEHNLETQRRMATWYELKAAYAAQKGAPMKAKNPRRRTVTLVAPASKRHTKKRAHNPVIGWHWVVFQHRDLLGMATAVARAKNETDAKTIARLLNMYAKKHVRFDVEKIVRP